MEAQKYGVVAQLTIPEMFTFLSSRGYECIIEQREFETVEGPSIHSVNIIKKGNKEIKVEDEKNYAQKQNVIYNVTAKELRQIVLETNQNHLQHDTK
jgi:hypothetical protein